MTDIIDYETPIVKDNSRNDFSYTKEKYKTAIELQDYLWFETNFNFKLDKNWVWCVLIPTFWQWEYVDNCIEDLYDYD